MQTEWLIVGGGIHGVHIAVQLLGAAHIPASRLRILDDQPLLHRWRSRCDATGMEYLRSPVVHHLDIDPFSLRNFAKRSANTKGIRRFRAPYDRPSLELFDRHSQSVLDSYALEELRIPARAERVRLQQNGVTIQTSTGEEVETQQVILALGPPEQTEWPGWAPVDNSKIGHVFDVNSEAVHPRGDEEVLIVGGGITAAQLAVRYTRQGNRVRMLSSHSLRKRQFDSAPGWLGPKFLAGFNQVQSKTRRREIIQEARYRGSIPSDVFRKLHSRVRSGAIILQRGQVDSLVCGSRLQAFLKEGSTIETDRVVLATGFRNMIPGGALVSDLKQHLELPCAPCGYPIVDRDLRWHDRVFAAGALGELELGPAARNIAGARMAGQRIAAVAKQDVQSAAA